MWVGPPEIVGQNPPEFGWVLVGRQFMREPPINIRVFTDRVRVKCLKIARSRGPKNSKIVGSSWVFSRMSLEPTRSERLTGAHTRKPRHVEFYVYWYTRHDTSLRHLSASLSFFIPKMAVLRFRRRCRMHPITTTNVR